MSGMGISKAIVQLDLKKVYPDAFKSDKVFMFIPKTRNGDIVSVEKATWLECWTSSEHVRDEVPHSLQNSGLAIGNILIKKPEDAHYAQLSRSVAFGSLMGMSLWLKTLWRYPGGDVLNFTTYDN